MPKITVSLLWCIGFLLLVSNTQADFAYLSPHHSIDGGAGGAANVNFAVKSTIGQTASGSLLSQNNHMQTGFGYIIDSFANADIDADGLDDDWELAHFGHLDFDADDDPDGDQLTNDEEFQLGFDPNDGISDTDADKILDRWELDYIGHLDSGRGDDSDADGIINYLEYKMDSNPMDASDRPSPGNYYEYDGLGRIKKVIRIPAQ